MDAFYAAVEQRNNPRFRGKPLIVGGKPASRGVVATCSYEARKYGIHSAMPAAEAHRRCPHAIFVSNPDFSEYQRVSRQIMDIFHEVSSRVEPLSLDEAFLDVSVNKHDEASATCLAQWIRHRIRKETGLTASAGVSYNKFLAKIASDWKKPDGLTVITPEQAGPFLDSLPVGKFFGVGPVTARTMQKIGIFTGKDLKSRPLWQLTEVFGKAGYWYYQVCRGIDNREVSSRRTRKSLGKEHTFESDIRDIRQMEEFLLNLSQSLWHNLQKRQLHGKTLTVKVKYSNFRQVTRSYSAAGLSDNLDVFQRAALRLLQSTEAASIPVRLLGISVSSFGDDNNWADYRQLEFDF